MKLIPVALAMCLLGGGCTDHQERAAQKVGEVAQLAREIGDEAQQGQDALRGLLEDQGVAPGFEGVVAGVQGNFAAIDANAGAIEGLAQSALVDDITKLENPKSLLDRLLPVLRVWGWVALAVVVAGLLLYTGVLKLLRPIGQGVVGSLVRLFGPGAAPKAVREQAELDAEAYSATPSNAALHTRIAVARSRDPRYDRVFEKKKNELKENQAWKTSGTSLNSTSGRTSSPSSASVTSEVKSSSPPSSVSVAGSSKSSLAPLSNENHDPGDEESN